MDFVSQNFSQDIVFQKKDSNLTNEAIKEVQNSFQEKQKTIRKTSSQSSDFNLEYGNLNEHLANDYQDDTNQNQYQNFRTFPYIQEDYDDDEDEDYDEEENSNEIGNQDQQIQEQQQQILLQQSFQYQEKIPNNIPQQPIQNQNQMDQEIEYSPKVINLQNKININSQQQLIENNNSNKLDEEIIENDTSITQKEQQYLQPENLQQFNIQFQNQDSNQLMILNNQQTTETLKNQNSLLSQQISQNSFIKQKSQNSNSNEDPYSTSNTIINNKKSHINLFQNCVKTIQKQVQGIAIIDIHQLNELQFFQQQFYKRNYRKLKKEIIKSFLTLHNSFVAEHSYLKMEQFEKNGFFQQIVTFQNFSLNTTSWPYVASYTINMKFPIFKEDIDKINLFCEQKNAQSHEIFDAFQPNQITLIIQFWQYDSQIQSIFEERLLKNQNQLNQQNKKMQEEIVPQQVTLQEAQIEIPHEQFTQTYKELMNIGEGSFGKVDLFYDFQGDRLVAVKTFNEIVVKMKEKEEEMKVLMDGLKNQNNFDDKQIQGQTKDQQRNIAREVKQLLELNYSKKKSDAIETDVRKKYVLDLIGVIPIPKYNPKVMQKLGGPDYKKYKGMKLCLNFFGGCEFQNKKLTCDVRHYLKNNSENLFQDDFQKKQFIENIFEQILEAFAFVHQNHVVLRDFKDDNILIRRRYDPENFGKSIYEIQLCDFGMSKKKPQDLSFKPLVRENSIAYNSINRFRHPRFYNALMLNQDLEYQKQDDIFGLGILLFKLYEEHLKMQFDSYIRDFIEYLTGFEFKIVEQYYNNHDIKDYNQACQQLLEQDCKNWQECWENIPNDIEQILNSPIFKNWKNSIQQQ